MKPRVIAIIQGRMSSSRLPVKVLAKAWKENEEPQHCEHTMPDFVEAVRKATEQEANWKMNLDKLLAA